ncbi:hypothetical protein AGABI1DRAFT_116138, partial [Agaricus bisporus var. burnettii JB137-S8]
MGFPIPQAKAALAANNNDVQAALNQLLALEGGRASNGRGTPNSPTTSTSTSSQQQPVLPRRRDREIFREREQQVDTSSPGSTNAAGVQAQAEQLLAQATVISRGMFSKASSFLKEKSAQVQKAVEEHRSSSAGSGSAGGVSGRPRWAQ